MQKFVLRSALRPNQISFSHSLGQKRPTCFALVCLLSPAADVEQPHHRGCAARGSMSGRAHHGPHPQVSQPCPHRRVGQGVHDCGIDFGGDILRRALGQPKPMPYPDTRSNSRRFRLTAGGRGNVPTRLDGTQGFFCGGRKHPRLEGRRRLVDMLAAAICSAYRGLLLAQKLHGIQCNRSPIGVGMPALTIKHTTTYQYRQPVAFGEHRMMMRPRDSHDQSLIEAKLVITPTPISIRRAQDAFGNHLDIVSFADRAQELRFESTIRLDHSHADIDDDDIEESARNYPFVYGAEELLDLIHLIERKSFDPDCQVERWARTFLQKDRPTNTSELLIDLTHGIRRTFRYARRHEKGVQTPHQTLALGSGSCRDLAMLMIDAARSLGMAARFVSGYLHVFNDDHRGGGNTHAWAQVYLPGPGWVDFDPSSGIVGNRDLVRVAVVRDPRQAIPLRGTFMGSPSDYIGMNVEVAVTSGAAERRNRQPPMGRRA
jgi:transglutaminase-like putative cysteine protease